LPKKPKSPCRFGGCSELTNERYCDQHRKAINNYYNKYQRDPETNKRYNSIWRKIRKEFIKSNPLCKICKQDGKLTPAQEVHHVIPLSENGTHDISNLQSLCKYHHSSESTRSGERWNKKAKVFK